MPEESSVKIVYIAGKFRGPTPWDVEQNVRRAEEAALEVAKHGAMPLCPHANTRFFDGQCSDAFWLDGTLELLKRCDAIMLVSNWRDSAGARAEMEFALANGIAVFEDFVGLAHWLTVNQQ